MRSVIAISLWLWVGLGTAIWGGVHGCTSAFSQQTAETTLNVMAEVIDPAYAAATDMCLGKQTSVVKTLEAQQITPAQAQALIGAIRADCDRVEAHFERIRQLHEAAKLAYKAHDTGQLDTLLVQLHQAWQELKGGGS